MQGWIEFCVWQPRSPTARFNSDHVRPVDPDTQLLFSEPHYGLILKLALVLLMSKVPIVNRYAGAPFTAGFDSDHVSSLNPCPKYNMALKSTGTCTARFCSDHANPVPKYSAWSTNSKIYKGQYVACILYSVLIECIAATIRDKQAQQSKNVNFINVCMIVYYMYTIHTLYIV